MTPNPRRRRPPARVRTTPPSRGAGHRTIGSAAVRRARSQRRGAAIIGEEIVVADSHRDEPGGEGPADDQAGTDRGARMEPAGDAGAAGPAAEPSGATELADAAQLAGPGDDRVRTDEAVVSGDHDDGPLPVAEGVKDAEGAAVFRGSAFARGDTDEIEAIDAEPAGPCVRPGADPGEQGATGTAFVLPASIPPRGRGADADSTVPESGEAAGQAPESGEATEELPEPGAAAGQAPESGEATEELPESGEAAGQAPEPGAADDGDDAEAPTSVTEHGEQDAGALALRRGRLALRWGLAAAILVLLVWGGTALATTQHVFGDAMVSGTAVGGMDPTQAEAAVAQAAAAQLAQPVTVTVDDASDALIPAESGVSVDAAATIRQLTGFTLNPITLVQRLGGEQVEVVTNVDAQVLTGALNSRLDTLSVGTRDASVTLTGTTAAVTAGVAGTGVDVEASVQALSAAWPYGEQTVQLRSGTTLPGVTDAEAQALVDEVLTPLLSDSITVTAEGTEVADVARGDAVLTPEQLAAATIISSQAGTISAALDPQAVHDEVIRDMGPGIETPAVDAGYSIDGSAAGAVGAQPVFVPGVVGQSVDSAALVQLVLDAGRQGTDASSRTVTVPVAASQPEHGDVEDAWGVTQVVGEYSTPFHNDPARTQNLVAGTAAINGTVVLPGQAFSLSEEISPVDAQHGFVSSGVIENGVHKNAMGGGLSQVATTVFNAAFEAGMDDIEHHAHSVWFERYPAGREATLWTGHLDVKFGNSTPYAVLVQAWVADNRVHVRLWSTPYYEVSITESERTNFRPVTTQTSTGPGCTPYPGGQSGFDITVTRHRTAPDGASPQDDVLKTAYSADNRLVCAAAPTPTTRSRPDSLPQEAPAGPGPGGTSP